MTIHHTITGESKKYCSNKSKRLIGRQVDYIIHNIKIIVVAAAAAAAVAAVATVEVKKKVLPI